MSAPFGIYRMCLRMIPTAGCVTMEGMCCVVTSVPVSSTPSAQDSSSLQRTRTTSGSVPSAR